MTDHERLILNEVAELIENEQEQIQATDSFSEFEHIYDRTMTLKEKLDVSAELLRSLLDTEMLRRMTPQERKERRAKQEYHNPLEVVIQTQTKRH
jgi:Cdc6-like AAA superfamily ATPase